MKNRRKSLITVIGSALFIALATTGISVAWFTSVADLSTTNTPIGGVVQDTYYESGDGSAESPYVITRPRHLYNLAWLQDLGFYNKHDGSEDDHQFYFKLGDNIDMSSFGPIPPIGTEKNPFVGNFDGQGFVISGITISNDFNDYNSHPSVISDWNGATSQPIDQPHILGLFGIVGDYTNANKPTSFNSAVNEFKNTGITGATIKTTANDSLMGVAAGYVSGNMSNVLVDVSTVDVSDEIVGNTTSYGGFTQNISDYTLVGYTQNAASVKKAEQSIYDVEITSNLTFNAVDQANDDGWGGSINMKTIYYRLYAFKKNKMTNVEDSFYWKENRFYYDGVEEETERTGTKTVSSASGEGSYTPHMQRFVGSEQSGHEFIGNYNFFHRADSLINNTTYSTTDQSYLYLCGGHYENRSYKTTASHTGYPITDNSGHYFSALSFTTGSSSNNAGTVGNSNEENATLWSVPTSGSDYISTTYRYNDGNEVTYYLYVYDTNQIRLSTNPSNRTQFTYSKNQSTGKIKYVTSSGYYLDFDGSNWVLKQSPNPSTVGSYMSNGYQIYYNGHYLSRTDNTTTGYVSGISSASTYGWGFENTSDNNNVVAIENATSVRIFCMVSGSNTRYYIRDNGAQNNYWKVGLTTTRNQGQIFTVTSAGNGVYYFAEGSYHLVCDTGHSCFSVRTANDSNQLYRALTVKLTSTILSEFETTSHDIYESQSTTKLGPDHYKTSADSTNDSEKSHMYYTSLDTTYFPLNVEKDISAPITSASNVNTAINSGDLDPKSSNTGYIVSGSDLVNKSSYTMNQSSIRVSEYNISNVSQSFNVSPNQSSTISDFPDSTVYTINTSGTETNMGAVDTTSASTIYPRYSETKPSFYQNSLTTTSNGSTKANANVYGLHFMTSKISMDSIVEGSKISILGNKCDKYQLPVNCVDFNLKQKGVINFFAGTYFSGNDSFFSLYQIIRNNDADIKTDGSGEPITGQYNSFDTISDVKEIVAVYSNDAGTKTSKYSNIYKYKKIVNGNSVYTYSEPYRFDGNLNKFKMDKNSTTDLTTPYVDNYEMSQSDFNSYVSTYGYTQRLDSPNQLGKQASAYTSNRIYYFEFPMNAGEYCLGSVDGGTGAYLLYLDIGANAAKTNRTIFYEHFTIDEKTYTYPVGVSLKDLGDPEDYPTRIAVIDLSEVIDDSDSACMRIIATAKGEFTIDRNSSSVALTRAQTNKAPPVYSGDDITRVYETSTSANVTVESLTSHTYDTKRMQYYDYNVNLEYLTVTTFVDAADAGGDYTRTYVSQTVYSGNTTSSSVVSTYKYYPGGTPAVNQLDSMKIYSTTNGIKYDSSDIVDVDIIEIDDAKMSDDLIVTFKLFQDNGNSYEDVTTVATHIDGTNINGTYYISDYYVISFIPTSGSTITIKIVNLTNGETIYYESTLITGADQVITEGPQP